MVTHTGIKKYKCDFCGSKFSCLVSWTTSLLDNIIDKIMARHSDGRWNWSPDLAHHWLDNPRIVVNYEFFHHLGEFEDSPEKSLGRAWLRVPYLLESILPSRCIEEAHFMLSREHQSISLQDLWQDVQGTFATTHADPSIHQNPRLLDLRRALFTEISADSASANSFGRETLSLSKFVSLKIIIELFHNKLSIL